MNRDEFYIALERNRAYVEEHKDELMHHGIKGQKWGVRRYQNPDGTLTAEGRARYGRLKDSYEKGVIALEGNERTAKTLAKVGAPVIAGTYGLMGGTMASELGAGTGAAIGIGALSGGLGLAALGGGMALGIGINHLIKKHYNKRISEINDLMDDEKMKKAQELIDSVKNKTVEEITDQVLNTPVKDSAQVIKDAEKNNAGFYEDTVSVKAKNAYDNFKSGAYNKEVEDAAAKFFYKEYKDWYENYYSDENTGAITKTLSEQQFRNEVLPKMRKTAFISNDGNITFDLDHPGFEDPLGGHALTVQLTTDDKGKRHYDDYGING